MTGKARSDVGGTLGPAGVANLDLPNPSQDGARLRALATEGPLGIFEHDLEGRCSYANAAFEVIMGITPRDALGFGWQRVVHADDLAELEAIHVRDAGRSAEFRVLRRDGSQRWVRVHAVPVRDERGEVVSFFGTLDDITDRKRLEARLDYDATHDRLTGLGSRALLVEQLNAALARARRSGGAVALLFVDIDGFKRVNDMLGHAVGDELLVQVAQRLRASVREADVCVRLGGDEFVVACTDMESLDLAQVLGERLLAAVNEPFVVHGHEVHVGASIGIATAQGEDTVSVDQMLSNADVAAYRAKRAGRGRVALFDEDLRRRLAGGRRIARGVERLLDEPRLPLLLAPIVELRTGRVVGFDCSVDWSSAGIDDQAALSQVIDEAGLARALDIARLRTVIGQLADWRRQPPGAIVPGLGVVLTPAGAQAPTIGEIVRDQLARSAVAPSLCWIGIPESAVARDVDAAAKVAAALDAIGVGVALRDFGRAVASLEQLRRVPAATVAIAGVLVSVVDGPEAALAAAVVDYARALGRVVAAFGVETEEQAARVAALGCEFASGPAFGAPVAPDEVGRFLAPRSL